MEFSYQAKQGVTTKRTLLVKPRINNNWIEAFEPIKEKGANKVTFQNTETHVRKKKALVAKPGVASFIGDISINVDEDVLRRVGNYSLQITETRVQQDPFSWVVELQAEAIVPHAPAVELPQSTSITTAKIERAPAPEIIKIVSPAIGIIPGHYDVTLDGRDYGFATISAFSEDTSSLDVVFKILNAHTMRHEEKILIVKPQCQNGQCSSLKPVHRDEKDTLAFKPNRTSFDGIWHKPKMGLPVLCFSSALQISQGKHEAIVMEAQTSSGLAKICVVRR